MQSVLVVVLALLGLAGASEMRSTRAALLQRPALLRGGSTETVIAAEDETVIAAEADVEGSAIEKEESLLGSELEEGAVGAPTEVVDVPLAGGSDANLLMAFVAAASSLSAALGFLAGRSMPDVALKLLGVFHGAALVFLYSVLAM